MQTDDATIGAVPKFFCEFIPARKKRAARLHISIDVEYSVDLEITRESEFDRVAKAARVSVEPQTGDPEFDRSCYLASENPEFAQRALASEKARDAVCGLLGMGAKKILHHGSVLEAYWSGPDAETMNHRAAEVAQLLSCLTLHFKRAAEELGYQNRLPHTRSLGKRYLLIPLGLVLALLIWAFFISLYKVLDPGTLFLSSLILSLPVFTVAALFAITRMRGNSRSHRNLAALILLLLGGSILGAHALYSFANAAFDSSDPQTHTVTVTEKYTTKSGGKRGRRTRYHIRMQSWRPGEAVLSLQINRDQYERTVPGQSAAIIISRKGALGFEWIPSITIKP